MCFIQLWYFPLWIHDTSFPFSLSGTTSYRQIWRSPEATGLDVQMTVSLWNFIGISAALLRRCLGNFRAIESPNIWASKPHKICLTFLWIETRGCFTDTMAIMSLPSVREDNLTDFGEQRILPIHVHTYMYKWRIGHVDIVICAIKQFTYDV